MTFLVYFILYSSCIYLATRTTRTALRHNGNIWSSYSVYLLLIVFALIVGTRYMVGKDYPGYMDIVQLGEAHYYYEHVEFIPRKLIDLVNALDFEFYWWFILMAFSQIFFIARAVRGHLLKLFPWIIFTFLALYLAFFMNVVRQGAALSCFLCAATYAQERKLLPYLLFFLVGFLCHSSIIVWLPTYWILNRELFPNIRVQYLLLIASAFILPPIIERLIDATRPYWELFGYGYQAENFTGEEEADVMGSGLGVILRYVRWSIIIAYYNKLKEFYGNNRLIFFYNLFFIGICFDYSSMLNLHLSRVFMYGSFIEIIILSYLLYYLSRSRKEINVIIFIFLIALLIVFPIYSIYSGVVEWKFVWDRLTYL